MNVRKPMARAGFTLLELLVAVAVIATLIGILTVGLRSIVQRSKANATKVSLANLQAMVAELEASAGTNRQPPYSYDAGAMQTYAAATPYNVWKDGQTSTPGTIQGLANPLRVTSDSPTRLTSDAFKNTHLILATLASAPKNRTALSQFAAQSLLAIPEDTLTVFKEAATPLPLDAWNNPIIFVPAAGLLDVTFEGQPGADGKYPTADDPHYLVTSQGALAAIPTVLPTAGSRGFWASAGPDGDFSTGDDNVYSFEN